MGIFTNEGMKNTLTIEMLRSIKQSIRKQVKEFAKSLLA
jgi:hypothetical protein